MTRQDLLRLHGGEHLEGPAIQVNGGTTMLFSGFQDGLVLAMMFRIRFKWPDGVPADGGRRECRDSTAGFHIANPSGEIALEFPSGIRVVLWTSLPGCRIIYPHSNNHIIPRHNACQDFIPFSDIAETFGGTAGDRMVQHDDSGPAQGGKPHAPAFPRSMLRAVDTHGGITHQMKSWISCHACFQKVQKAFVGTSLHPRRRYIIYT